MNYLKNLKHDLYYNLIFPVRRFLVYRVWDRRYVITCRRLQRLGYVERDRVLLHACFQILCDYVERDLAWVYYRGQNIHQIGKLQKMTFHCGWNRSRNSSWGLRYLENESRQKNYSYEEREALGKLAKLYRWWNEARGSRPDIHDPNVTLFAIMEYFSRNPFFKVEGLEKKSTKEIERLLYEEDEFMSQEVTKLMKYIRA